MSQNITCPGRPKYVCLLTSFCVPALHVCFSQFFLDLPSPGFNMAPHFPFTLWIPLEALLGIIRGCFSQRMTYPSPLTPCYLSWYVTSSASLPRQPNNCLYESPTMNFITIKETHSFLFVFFSSNGTFVNGEKIGN